MLFSITIKKNQINIHFLISNRSMVLICLFVLHNYVFSNNPIF